MDTTTTPSVRLFDRTPTDVTVPPPGTVVGGGLRGWNRPWEDVVVPGEAPAFMEEDSGTFVIARCARWPEPVKRPRVSVAKRAWYRLRWMRW